MSSVNTIETGMGLNRTGIGLSPLLASEMMEGTANAGTTASEQTGVQELAEVRKDYGTRHEQVGTMPPPSSLKGMAKTVKDALKGRQPTILLDRLGDRLAFERTGVCLYEAFLDKFDALGSWEGGPSRADIESISQDELRHFELLHRAIESLGADPTTVTPTADISGVESLGVLQVVADPRTTLPQALHAILSVELIDSDGWRMLADLAQLMGHADLAVGMEAALRDEERHLALVRGWLTREIQMAAQRELEPQPAPSA